MIAPTTGASLRPKTAMGGARREREKLLVGFRRLIRQGTARREGKSNQKERILRGRCGQHGIR